MARRFVEVENDAITRIPVSANAFRPVHMDAVTDPKLLNKQLDLRFGERSTLQDLVSALEAVDLPVVLGNDGIRNEKSNGLPFSKFSGSFGELLKILRRSSSITASQKGRHVHLGLMQRYSVDLPQNSDIIKMIAGEIAELGGVNVVESLTSGQVIYHAPPNVQDDVIATFLERTSQNLAMITMQVAVVSLALNDTTSQGFDWNAFRLGMSGKNSSLLGIGNSDNGDGSENGDGSGVGTLLKAGSTAASIAHTGSGEIFGRAVTYTVSSAISFLSTFGQTDVTQNVELRTISGQEVMLRSGQEVPYVSGISSTTTGDSSTGSTETETIETGLTLNLSPHFDSATNLVTMDIDLTQRQILQFVELSAGNDLGTITQPLTQDQSLTDIVRIPAGQTVVVGGLQVDNVSTTGSEPSFLRKHLPEKKLFGSRKREVTRNAFFIIVRPTITVFQRR